MQSSPGPYAPFASSSRQLKVPFTHIDPEASIEVVLYNRLALNGAASLIINLQDIWAGPFNHLQALCCVVPHEGYPPVITWIARGEIERSDIDRTFIEGAGCRDFGGVVEKVKANELGVIVAGGGGEDHEVGDVEPPRHDAFFIGFHQRFNHSWRDGVVCHCRECREGCSEWEEARH